MAIDNEACGSCGGPLDDGHKPDCPVMEFRRAVAELEATRNAAPGTICIVHYARNPCVYCEQDKSDIAKKVDKS